MICQGPALPGVCAHAPCPTSPSEAGFNHCCCNPHADLPEFTREASLFFQMTS